MRVGLVSDAHANAVGLRAAFDDLERRGVDAVVALGDMAQGGPQPVECSASTARRTITTGVVLPEDPPDAFDGTGADVLAGGHVHVPQLRRVGAAWYVNPGSVGLGYDHLQPDDNFRFDPWASYAIVGTTSVEFHRVPFDLDQLAAITRASGLPLAEEVSSHYRRS